MEDITETVSSESSTGSNKAISMHSQSKCASSGESKPSNSSPKASLQELLKRSKVRCELHDTVKGTVKDLINSLSKVELVDILIYILGLELEDETGAKADKCNVVTNGEASETNLSSPEKNEKRPSDAFRKRQVRSVKLKVVPTNEKLDHSVKPLKKRRCLDERILKGDAILNSASMLERQGETEQQVLKLKSFVCKTCGLMFSVQSVYRKHLQTHAQSLKCDVCNKVFKSKDSLYHHQRGLHGKEKPYHCDVCNSYFSFHHSYKLHLQRHKGERPFSCKFCSKTYLTSSHLKEHTRAVHLDSSIICHVCGKKFSYNSALKLHLQIHVDDKTYRCSTCSKVFNTKRGLKRHSLHHLENKRVKCNVCGKYFKSDNYLNIHSKLHSNTFDRSYSCDICGKSFYYKCTLDSHAKTHNNFQSLACAICDKTFKSKASLYSHKYVHNEGLAYRCTICSKSFKTKSCLSAHTKRHQNQSTFVCSMCGKTFPDKGGLSKHTKTVHSPRLYYSCKICKRTGTRADNMRTHVKSHRDQVGANEDLMNYICVKESKSEMQLCDLQNNKSKHADKGISNVVCEARLVNVGIDSMFHKGSQPLLASMLPLVPSSFRIMTGKESNLTDVVGNSSESCGNLLSGVQGTDHHDSRLFQLDIAKTDSQSLPMSSSASSDLQAHSSGVSSSNQLLPGYHGQYLPMRDVIQSRSALLKPEGGGVNLLAASSPLSLSSADGHFV